MLAFATPLHVLYVIFTTERTEFRALSYIYQEQVSQQLLTISPLY